MKVNTSNFGEIEIEKDGVISFGEGLPGFEDEKKFIIILNGDRDNPFHWLQSTQTPELSFVILNPFEIFPDYDVLIPETAINKLEIEDREDVAIYTIVVIPEDIKRMTANLLGPIVVNKEKRLAKQVILEEDKYSTKELIFKDAVDPVRPNPDSKGGK